jgi:hypothetical protein
MTLYKFSEPDSFRVILIDQIKGGISNELWHKIKPWIHLYMHPVQRQYGYAKAMNLGIVQALHQGTPLICCSNDDVEIMDSRWMQGVRDTFAKDERIVGVCPMSPRVAGWGYGVEYNPEILPYKEEYTKEDYDYLIKGDFTDSTAKLPATYPRKPAGTIIDGAVFVMPYFKREIFEKVGLLDEHYYPGSGEDVDMMARIYNQNGRVVSTSLSWIWHFWSKSKDLFASGELEDPYYKPKDHPYWNNESELWPNGFDVWGKDKDKKPYPRVPEIFVDDIL